jgi:hypothetical protein
MRLPGAEDLIAFVCRRCGNPVEVKPQTPFIDGIHLQASPSSYSYSDDRHEVMQPAA